ncbi:MAG: 5'-nucleotidase C-terminal domain-containing protein [Spirochaetaceae bacterium]|nr:5'-nucleotidase C-terminal domain-containing protein [Spirochaetaceae bacterium]
MAEQDRGRDAGRFRHVSSLSVVYDPGKLAGERVVAVQRAGAPLALDATFTLATNNYLGRGDGYAVSKDKVRLVDAYAGTLMASQVIDDVAAQGSVSPVVVGRLHEAD